MYSVVFCVWCVMIWMIMMNLKGEEDEIRRRHIAYSEWETRALQKSCYSCRMRLAVQRYKKIVIYFIGFVFFTLIIVLSIKCSAEGNLEK